MMRTLAVAMPMAMMMALGVGCSSSSSMKGARAIHKLEYPVEVAPLVTRQMQYMVTAPGTIEAFQQVQITARVAGAVDKVGFAEGQEVKQGEVLRGDRERALQIAVEQAQGARCPRREASEGAGRGALARRQRRGAGHPGLVPGEEIEQKHRPRSHTAKADVQTARRRCGSPSSTCATRRCARRSTACIQTRTVQPGQYVQPGTCWRRCSARSDAAALPGHRAGRAAPQAGHDRDASRCTRARGRSPPRSRSSPAPPIRRRAWCRSPPRSTTTEHKYWLRPGSFCEVTVPIGDARQAIVVPRSRCSRPRRQHRLRRRRQARRARARSSQLGMHTRRRLGRGARGLTAGELLVVRGVEALSDGAPVKVGNASSVDEAPEAARVAPPPAPTRGAGAHRTAPAAARASPRARREHHRRLPARRSSRGC